jgi:two-component system KDP operon response regulator KdpE
MSDAPLILVVEDDPPIRNFIRACLRTQGYRVLEVDKGEEALSQAASHVPDLLILDLGLPDLDGMEVIRRLREWSRVPIIVVSARGNERGKVEALDAGADDYLTKPFGTGELLARIRVAFRRAAALPGGNDADTASSVFSLRGLEVDLGKRKVTVDGHRVRLTPIEYRLLALMVQHAGKVLTHRFLLQTVWGPGSVNDTHSLRVFMATLRRKLEADPTQPKYLLTEVGVGYRLLDE